MYALSDDHLRRVNASVGGTGRERDPRLLSSLQAAVYGRGFKRPLHPTLPQRAAALMSYITQAAVFESANERTALTAGTVLCTINGHRIVWTDSKEADAFIRAVGYAHPTVSWIADRIEARLQPIPRS
ncbi:hypothetical protein ACWGR4_04450 [Embleya sp. NPDC055664]|uniref:hypothetical protein n=2 Tax=Embleya TaxID=2699295 RepID=UPI00369A723E